MASHDGSSIRAEQSACDKSILNDAVGGSAGPFAAELMEGQMGIMDLISGFVGYMSLRVVVLLRVPDIISKSQGSNLTVEEIASQLPSKNPRVDYLRRILKFLATKRVFSETQHVNANGQKFFRYGLTGISKLLVQENNPVSMAPIILVQSNKLWQAPFYHIHESILEGCDAFVRANGKDLWTLTREDPELNAGITAGMAAHAKLVVGQILEFYQGFSELESLVDVGGGNGEALKAILAAYPHLSAINFDLPHVVAIAEPIPGVVHVGGDMFQSVPSADAIFMKVISDSVRIQYNISVLHDWNDDKCRQILRNCHRALPENGRIILAETVMSDEEEDEERESPTFAGNSLKLGYNVLMICHSGGAVERSRKQWEDLLTSCGFGKMRIRDGLVPQLLSVIEAFKIN